MPKIKIKEPKTAKVIIHSAIKYWIEPKRYGYEIKILDEADDITSIECHIKKKYRPHDEEIFRR
jgi:hypothetical protein